MSATVIIRPNRRAVGEPQTGVTTGEKPYVSAVPLGRNGGNGLGYVFALLLFVIGSDLYVVAPLLPGIQNTLHCTVSQAGLVVTAFTAGYTLASPLIGGLADRLGRPVVLYTGTSIFIIFEAISAWAPSYPILIVGRAMTGIAAAAITPTVYTIHRRHDRLSSARPRHVDQVYVVGQDQGTVKLDQANVATAA